MGVTNTDIQANSLEEKIEKYFAKAQYCYDEHPCPIRDLMSQTLDKWSVFCIYNLAYFKKLRFNQLKRRIPEISSRMLSVTLKKLEAKGVVSRKLYAEVPPRVEYQLTEFGKSYAERVADITIWVSEQSPYDRCME